MSHGSDVALGGRVVCPRSTSSRRSGSYQAGAATAWWNATPTMRRAQPSRRSGRRPSVSAPARRAPAGRSASASTSVHECRRAAHLAVRATTSIISTLRATHPLPEVVGYWGALLGGEHPDDRALAGFAGDLCVDGALGSRTAALRAPYDDADTAGHRLPRRGERCATTSSGAPDAAVQAGFHVIGDRGLDVVLAGLELAAEQVGIEAVVAARHRLEHVEMASTGGDRRCWPRFGVVASVQPAFDAAWGGAGRHVRSAARADQVGADEPAMASMRGGRCPARVRVRQPGHADRPVGRGARRRLPPQPRRSGCPCPLPSRPTPGRAPGSPRRPRRPAHDRCGWPATPSGTWPVTWTTCTRATGSDRTAGSQRGACGRSSPARRSSMQRRRP